MSFIEKQDSHQKQLLVTQQKAGAEQRLDTHRQVGQGYTIDRSRLHDVCVKDILWAGQGHVIYVTFTQRHS